MEKFYYYTGICVAICVTIIIVILFIMLLMKVIFLGLDYVLPRFLTLKDLLNYIRNRDKWKEWHDKHENYLDYLKNKEDYEWYKKYSADWDREMKELRDENNELVKKLSVNKHLV